ncbi:MAG: hypothetical protein ACE5IO_02440 [Thermoplasmata archaeon]
MSYAEIMNIDTTHALKNRTWWWWWWIFFFRNPENPQRTKQMVVLWGTRNCKRLLVNDHSWERKSDTKRDGRKVTAYGLTACWYFDGTRMIDPVFIDDGPLVAQWSEDERELSLVSDSKYVFGGKGDSNWVKIERPDARIEIDLRPWTEYLSRIVPTGKEYFLHLAYAMHKIRGSRATGTVRIGERSEVVEGTAYFQKVRINSPTTPWYWGIFHSENGSYIDYFMPHFGPPMFRRTEKHSSKLDWGERMLSKGWQFYDVETDILHRVKNIRMRKRYQNDLPVFTLTGDDGKTRFEMEMTTYARAYWRIQQPLLKIFNTVLYYNEYPTNVTKFLLEYDGERITLEDLGPVVGNCEHSWGIV